jgi:antitoxin component YwqK of YwqJK toxin-antitoxin module
MKSTFLLSVVIIVLFTSSSFGQENKIDGKGQRKGEWFIMYKGDFLFYDYLDKLLSIDRMMVHEREVRGMDEMKYFEKVEYKKGIKQGPFYLYSGRKDSKGNYPLIASGQYLNGKISGEVSMFSYSTQQRICSSVFEEGALKDQEIMIEERDIRYSNATNFAVFGEQKVYPKIRIIKGVCVEEVVTFFPDYKYKLVRLVKNNNGFTRYLYGRNLVSGIVNVSNGLEVAQLNSDFKLNGIVSIYKETKVVYDTSAVEYRANYINGILNGISSWYDSQSGQKVMESNYVEGDLNGVCRLISKSGQILVEANYSKGLLNGKFVSYYLNDGSNISVGGPICVDKRNSDLYNVVEGISTQDIFKETIPMLKKRGYQLETEGYFKFCEANFINGILQDKYMYFHSNGAKLFKAEISNCLETDWNWYDRNGKEIYSLKQQKLELVKKDQDLQEEVIKRNNTLIPCNWCKKSFRFGDRINLQECHCFDTKDGHSITMFIDLFSTKGVDFCSKDCRMKYEEDCCRRSGHTFH